MSQASYASDPLAWLAARYGPALPRLTREPGLLAAVDQHRAALRDALPRMRSQLADYLLGFLDELHLHGWRPEHGDAFPFARLLAACHLADQHGMFRIAEPNT
ncbi:DUF6401 family natural product biosynthesis protein [Streptomyces nanhaiensis]|uniref:DUF6401 family natural product biosynthesis protein n=1 Tax=Streptomyces nanhaiensis TaxID=679319 RepID=UPI00399C5339